MSMYKQGKPYQVDVKAGNTVYICQCGQSKNPPYCDGSHADHPPAEPLAHKAEQDSVLYVCGCGKSSNKPFCDGSHEEP